MSSGPPLVGDWIVGRLRTADGPLGPPVPGTRIETRFDPDGSVAGTTGCNSFRGSYRTDASSIEIRSPATTRRFCLRPPGVMEQEKAFLGLITEANRFSVDETGDLTLADDAGIPLVEMTRAGPGRI